MPIEDAVREIRLYILQARPPKMLSCRPDGSDVETLFEDLGATPDGIQIDSENGFIYWSNMGEDFNAPDGTIERCRLDGSERTLLLGNGDVGTPKQLCLDPAGGYLFWGDREGMRVMRARVDGSDLETLVQRGIMPEDTWDELRHCVGVAVDHARGLVYWTQKGPEDAGKGRIFRAPIRLPEGSTPDNRSDIELLAENLPEPIDLHLTRDGTRLYWTDRGAPPNGNTFNRAEIGEYGLGPVEIVAGDFKEAIGLAVDESSNRAWISDLGGNIRLVDLCIAEERIIGNHGWLTGLALGAAPGGLSVGYASRGN
jgi:DNA-binding beta-propeller fold protein YncE